MNFVCKRFGSVKLFTYICKRILKNKFRKLNLHERRKTTKIEYLRLRRPND